MSYKCDTLSCKYLSSFHECARQVVLKTDPTAPLVALAFKLQESRFGQLTYMRLYQGTMRRGDTFYNVDKREKVKIPRLVRMHADKLEDIESASAGEILATFGVECATGHSFTDGSSESICSITIAALASLRDAHSQLRMSR